MSLTREYDKESENYMKVRKHTFQSQQRVKLRFILKKYLA